MMAIGCRHIRVYIDTEPPPALASITCAPRRYRLLAMLCFLLDDSFRAQTALPNNYPLMKVSYFQKYSFQQHILMPSERRWPLPAVPAPLSARDKCTPLLANSAEAQKMAFKKSYYLSALTDY